MLAFGALKEGGIIPACAGSTRDPALQRRHERDHPRVRGEHATAIVPVGPCLGSSPRARGAREGVPGPQDRRGIIPACAGSTCGSSTPSTATRDHPRVRGEHLSSYRRISGSTGSSPRARGARPAGADPAAGPGIIPACAGSTPCAPSPPSACWDHPRVRGEHIRGIVTIVSAVGIIPACAGSTFHGSMVMTVGLDHPRVRGEHMAGTIEPEIPEGSSPRARGALILDLEAQALGGIIPACAGSTSSGAPSGLDGGDHPRVRGEHPGFPRFKGSGWGIIPACAGSTW